MTKLLLIDGNAILHRAYYALPDWRNRAGEATAGVYGFLSMTVKAIEDLKPTHLVVVFDNPEPTFRHNLYVGYQTNREKERQVSEDIWGQVDKLKVIFEKAGVPVFSLPGFEADDIIGTLSKQAVAQYLTSNPSPNLGEGNQRDEVIIITGDRDLMQLVNDKVKLYMPQKGLSDGTVVDEEKVLEKMGVHPNQIVDYKGLVGDASDNYPGVSGIGPKTAGHLLAEYGTLENIYKNLDKTGDKIKMKLAEGFEAAMLSQKLATIRLDVPVTLNMSQAGVPDKERMLSVLKELGYKSLVRRAGGKEEDIKDIDDQQTKLFD
jgi:DNA polymerase I